MYYNEESFGGGPAVAGLQAMRTLLLLLLLLLRSEKVSDEVRLGTLVK